MVSRTSLGEKAAIGDRALAIFAHYLTYMYLFCETILRIGAF